MPLALTKEGSGVEGTPLSPPVLVCHALACTEVAVATERALRHEGNPSVFQDKTGPPSVDGESSLGDQTASASAFSQISNFKSEISTRTPEPLGHLGGRSFNLP